jgi:light-regulated signal transduction histidine kinase (bacteriophytochrome)
MLRPPSQYPIFDPDTRILHDGSTIAACDFCRGAVGKLQCQQHYAALKSKPEGFYECPFGFTSRSFRFLGKLWVITGVVAFPRFGSNPERRRASEFPAVRVARAAIDAAIRFLSELEQTHAEVIQQAAKVLPQAFHELRKLNAAVLQHAERERNLRGEIPSLVSIRSAAELMRNNFDILEALSNIEGMRALPIDSTVNLYDLVYKLKKVLEERAADKRMYVQVTGVRAIARGSQKSFPIVPAVLLENAIKYGLAGTNIRADISAVGAHAVLIVENQSELYINPETCFDRGVRFAPSVEGGGFGLFLAREIVSCHRGRIRCETTNGGVRMIVELPLETVIAGP